MITLSKYHLFTLFTPQIQQLFTPCLHPVYIGVYAIPVPSEGVYTCFLKKGSIGVYTSIEPWVSYKPQKEAFLIKISASGK